MARHTFGGSMADWAFTFNTDGSVSQGAGAVLTFWDSLAGGSQYLAAPLPGGVDDGTGLLDGTGNPIASVTCDGNGEIPDSLQGPDGVYVMAADGSGGSGPRRWLIANDMGDDLTMLLNAGTAAGAPEYVYYNTALVAYPVRPATSSVVWWVGPAAPPVGGTSGATGSDVWLNTTGATPPGGVASVTAADGSVVIGGTSGAPTVATGTLDRIAAIHPPVTDWPNNGVKITNVAAGVAGTDVATVSQLSASAGLLVPTSIKTSAYTAAAGDFVLVSTASANVTITLPSAPADQSRVGVKMVTQAGGNTVTVACGGTDRFNVAGGATSMTLLRFNQTLTMQYQASAGLWLITGTDPALPLDTTGTDIQAAGAQAPGATAKAADAGHVHPAVSWTPADNGLLAANGSLPAVGGGQLTIAGTLYLQKIWIRQPFTATTLWLQCSTLGAGASTTSFAGIWNSSGTLLTSSSDIGGHFAAPATTGPIPVNWTTPQSLVVSMGFVWVGWVFNLATTQPSIRTQSVASAALQNTNLTAATAACAVGGTSVTALASITPASNNIGATAFAYWAGIS